MIDKEQIDIVSVATYSPAHAEITIACANKGIRVIYCEKPVATKLPDAEKMLEAARRNKTLLTFNHQRRFDPNHRRLQKAIAEGQLGDLVSATVQWSTGRLGNVGTHVIDGLIMLTRRRIQAVSATLDMSGRPDCRGSDFHDPGAFGTLKLEGGVMAAIHAPDYAKIPGFHTEIYGNKGRAIVKGLAVTLESADGKIDNWAAPSDGVTSMDRALTEIIDYLDKGTPFPVGPEEGVHTFEAIVGFHASHARGSAWTELPLKGKDREIEVLTG
jgi:predicted dehydrogenase